MRKKQQVKQKENNKTVIIKPLSNEYYRSN